MLNIKNQLNWLRDHYDVLGKIFLFIVMIALLLAIFPREGKFRYEYQKGKPWQHDDLIAQVDIAILKPEVEYQNEISEAVKKSGLYFKRDHQVVALQTNNLINSFNKLKGKGSGIITDLVGNQTDPLTHMLDILDSIYSQGVITLTSEIENKPPEFEIFEVDGNQAGKKKISDYFTIQSAGKYINTRLSGTDEYSQALRELLLNSLRQNIVFDAENSKRAIDAMVNEITSTSGMIQSGEKIISRGELVNSDKFQILESYRLDYQSRLGTDFQYPKILLGQFVLIGITIIVFILFMLSFRKDIFIDNRRMLMLLLIILIMVYAAALTMKTNPDILQLLPFCLVPIIVRVFYDTRTAFFVHVITLILTAFLVPSGFEFLFQQLITGLIAIISVAEFRRRSQFFITALAIFITYSLIYTGMLLIQDGSIENINYSIFLIYGGSAALTLFSYPLIFIFEKLFGQVTDVTLMELSDTNSPLLRQLSLNAPGTFQHSMQVANIAEAAIYEIGGNSLLVRAGALYHDIGKMDMPMYFIENQLSEMNPHDELSYEESARIIVSHVIKGIEKAKKHKLPELLIDFIRTHHGTRMAEYFYNRQRIDFPEKKINDSDFRYPGPPPFSKETSVLMMADSVEAASRSLKSHTDKSISTLVESIIDKQIEMKQFVNSDLTLKDITRIKKILKKKLMSIYHVRMEYPSL
ncbi:MAG: HDIG domain-containing protein [Lentimicrobium sp.]|nr:HDIG domain-containing protein [Lentimicrobium sp.]